MSRPPEGRPRSGSKSLVAPEHGASILDESLPDHDVMHPLNLEENRKICKQFLECLDAANVAFADESLDFEIPIGHDLDFPTLTRNGNLDRNRAVAKLGQLVGNMRASQSLKECN